MLLNLHNKTIYTFYVVAIYKSSPLYLQLLSRSDVCSVGGVTEVYAVHFILKCGPQKNDNCFCNYDLPFCGGLSCITKIGGCILLKMKCQNTFNFLTNNLIHV